MPILVTPRLKISQPRLSVQRRNFKDLKPHLNKIKIAKKGIQRDTFSAVYNGKPVIIKVWYDPAILHYLAKEVRILAKLQKFPFIARLIEVGKDYFIQENVGGQTLIEYLNGTRASRLDPVKVLSTLASAASMESLIQKEGFSHNDLHPGNIVMTPAGVVIIDFGIAVEKAVDPENFRGAMVQDLFDLMVLSYIGIDSIKPPLASELISTNRRYAANVFDINEDTIGRYGRDLLSIVVTLRRWQRRRGSM